jgi:hypothetical protein
MRDLPYCKFSYYGNIHKEVVVMNNNVQSDIIEESKPLTANSSSIQDSVSDTQDELPKTEPSLFTLAREGMNGYTGAQILATIATMGIGAMAVNLLANDRNDKNDISYKITIDTLSMVAGLFTIIVLSYGHLRTEALRLRSKASEENIQIRYINLQEKLNEEFKLKEAALLQAQKELRTMEARLQNTELRAERAEKTLGSISSNSQLTQ